MTQGQTFILPSRVCKGHHSGHWGVGLPDILTSQQLSLLTDALDKHCWRNHDNNENNFNKISS